MSRERTGRDRPRPRGFDVICAGDALLSVAGQDRSSMTRRRMTRPSKRKPSVALRAGGGAISAALALAAQGLRVGLVTVLPDDTSGRALLARVAALGVDVGGVELGEPSRGLVFVKGGARQVVSFREEDEPIDVPEGWSSQVLLLSGMSPVVSHGAALVKAARAARRAGTVVVVDLHARWDLWQGRDPRSIRMVLREADVVWCTAHDLFGLHLDLQALRASLRKTAVLVSSDGAGHTSASGPFGEVNHMRAEPDTFAPLGEGDAFAAAICAELAGARHASESASEVWNRALRRGDAAARERGGG
jgi:2-dehydro-3-deoxygluconokinase